MRLCLADIPTVAAHEKLEASDMTREHIHPNEKQSESLHSALVDSFDEFAPPINFSRQQIETETEARVTRMLPGGAPDQETADLMAELDRLQTWTTLLMCRQVPMAREAYDLVQRTRCFIVERLYSGAHEHRKDRDEG